VLLLLEKMVSSSPFLQHLFVHKLTFSMIDWARNEAQIAVNIIVALEASEELERQQKEADGAAAAAARADAESEGANDGEAPSSRDISKAKPGRGASGASERFARHRHQNAKSLVMTCCRRGDLETFKASHARIPDLEEQIKVLQGRLAARGAQQQQAPIDPLFAPYPQPIGTSYNDQMVLDVVDRSHLLRHDLQKENERLRAMLREHEVHEPAPTTVAAEA